MVGSPVALPLAPFYARLILSPPSNHYQLETTFRSVFCTLGVSGSSTCLAMLDCKYICSYFFPSSGKRVTFRAWS